MSAPHAADQGQTTGSLASRLNWLRAGVLGANDGIVSVASIVVGVSGAAVSDSTLLVTGVAGLVAGALSMAAGEYVSVSTQRDSEMAAVNKERVELREDPAGELDELTRYIEAEGIDPNQARAVAERLTATDALAAHVRFEFGFNAADLTNPWAAAGSSLVSFVIGGLIPFLAIILTPRSIAVPVTMVAVACALALTGSVSASLGKAPIAPAVIRNVIGGLLAMAITYGVGTLFGA